MPLRLLAIWFHISPLSLLRLGNLNGSETSTSRQRSRSCCWDHSIWFLKTRHSNTQTFCVFIVLQILVELLKGGWNIQSQGKSVENSFNTTYRCSAIMAMLQNAKKRPSVSYHSEFLLEIYTKTRICSMGTLFLAENKARVRKNRLSYLRSPEDGKCCPLTFSTLDGRRVT